MRERNERDAREEEDEELEVAGWWDKEAAGVRWLRKTTVKRFWLLDIQSP